jgi:hypothetical protein
LGMSSLSGAGPSSNLVKPVLALVDQVELLEIN